VNGDTSPSGYADDDNFLGEGVNNAKKRTATV
jgi:hypothetical protein